MKTITGTLEGVRLVAHNDGYKVFQNGNVIGSVWRGIVKGWSWAGYDSGDGGTGLKTRRDAVAAVQRAEN